MNTTSQGINAFVIPSHVQAKVDQIMAASRARFGHGIFRMVEDRSAGDSGSGGDGGAGAGGQGGDSGSGGSGGSGSGGQGSGSGADQAQEVEDLPDWAQKIIRETRDEAAKNRTGRAAAEEQQQKILKAVAQAAGLKIEGDDEPTVEVLGKQLQDSQAETRETKAELVVWRNAAALKVDAAALTDSMAFARAIAKLDPSSETFEADVKKAAQAAAEQNPKLKATQAAAGSSSTDHGTGGTGGDGTRTQPKSLESAVSAAYQ